VNALRRILAAFTGNHPTRAWTLTGVYGTGKSALPIIWHLCAKTSQMRTLALEIAKNALGWDSPEYKFLKISRSKDFSSDRHSTARTVKPHYHTRFRAWRWNFWRSARTQPAIARKLVDLATEITLEKNGR